MKYDNLKLLFEKINKDKEELKTNISKTFTKIRNEINNREDELLSMIDKEYKDLFLNEETYNNYEKLHFQIKSSLEKQKIKESDTNVKFSQIINNCINIENNIKDINEIKEKYKLFNNLEIKFSSEEDNLIKSIKKIQ